MKQKICKICKSKFTPHSSLVKWCSPQCGYNNKKKYYIKKVSDKRKEFLKIYKIKRKEFLKTNNRCVVTGKLATEIHHMKGRIGYLLIDEKYFLPVSREGHIFIENNPKIAYEKKWSFHR